MSVTPPMNENNVKATYTDDEGKQHQVVMVASMDTSTLILPERENITEGTWIDDNGKPHKVILTANVNGGGGGGTSNYNELSNRPKINGVTLSGDKTSADLGIESLPAQTGHTTHFLTTNGNTASWQSVTENVIKPNLTTYFSGQIIHGGVVTLPSTRTTVTITAYTIAQGLQTTKETFCAQLNFATGSTPCTFTVPADGTYETVMKGADCSNGVFVPATDSVYSIMFFNNGTKYVGLVVKQ